MVASGKVLHVKVVLEWDASVGNPTKAGGKHGTGYCGLTGEPIELWDSELALSKYCSASPYRYCKELGGGGDDIVVSSTHAAACFC